ncbi:A24 family peptidase [Azotobacter chroococcum]|uniref:A24 family peptidase n=1 Tax=Azotobacter chroococcum TaxID=353 RepID=UPI001939F373|nr:A24 family peptidase [Azotobacter chroococcum]
MEQKLVGLLLLGLLAVAVVSDFRRHRISNLLILSGLALGLGSHFYLDSVDGLGSAFLGVLVGFVLFLPFYSFGGMAAGDVKLMAVVGGFLGPVATVSAAALSLIMGSVFGLLILLYKKQLFRLVQRYWAMASLRTYIAPQADDAARQRFPYAIAIFTGTLISLFWQPFGP